MESIPKPEAPVVQTPKKNKNKKKKILIILLFLLLFLIILILSFGLTYMFMNKDSNDDTDLSSDTTTNDETSNSNENQEDEEEPEIINKHRVAYYLDNNIWVADNDGKNKTQITTDGKLERNYTAYDWKEAGILTYAKCEGGCNIYTYDVDDKKETLLFEVQPFVTYISEISWSNDGETLGYFLTKSDGSIEVKLRNGTDETSLQMYEVPPGRGAGYHDGMEIVFSPDDESVAVLNTIITTGPTLRIFESDGTEIKSVESAFAPAFASNSAIYYVKSQFIVEHNLSTDTTTNVKANGDEEAVFDLQTSPDLKEIAYWTISSNGDPSSQKLTAYYLAVVGGTFFFNNSVAEPKWIDSDLLVGIKTSLTFDEMGGYSSEGLVKINKSTGILTVIETKPVYEFEVE